jgi:2-keto-3-deoxy-L-rhamnonate aldolase RhmA
MGTWDDNVAIFCQIEDVIGVQNVDEIAQVDGGMYINTSLVVMNHMMRVFLQLSKTYTHLQELTKSIVDGLMVGGYDLQASLKLPVITESMRHPVFLEAIVSIQRAADANGLTVLGSGALEALEDRVKLGWRAFLCSPDTTGILVHGNQELEACKARAVSAVTGKRNVTLH